MYHSYPNNDRKPDNLENFPSLGNILWRQLSYEVVTWREKIYVVAKLAER